MKRSLEKLWTSVQNPRSKPPTRSRAWKGATWAVGFLGIGIWIILAYHAFGPAGWIPWILGSLAGIGAFALLSTLLVFLGYLLSKIPWWYRLVVVVSLGLVFMTFSLAIYVVWGGLAVTLLLIVFSSLVGGIGAFLFSARGSETPGNPGIKITTPRPLFLTLPLWILSLSGLIAVGVLLFIDGFEVTPPPNMGELSRHQVQLLELEGIENPATLGPYLVIHRVYGPGKGSNDGPGRADGEEGNQNTQSLTDSSTSTPIVTIPRNPRSLRQQAPYLGEVDVSTPRVDGSLLLEGWSRLRRRYWGFGPDALPLNGHIWMPVGHGPFPLVVLVHGNHPMEQSSEFGYGYLAELLASRGFVVASLDMNFLNLSLTSNLLFFVGLQKENDARAWLILEHLAEFRRWNSDPSSDFYGKIDLDAVGLMGHSRGGEAIATAGLFNHLPFYPDNSQLRFDYHFGIRALVAIAPVDGQYKPSNRPVTLEDMNYLVLHGAQDMDVVTFMGASQYERVGFTGTKPGFKASWYIDGANHGQFNTDWGQDLFGPAMGLFNRRILMEPEDQQRIAQVALSGFFEASLNRRDEYRQLFQDPRRAGDWLPSTIILAQYHHGLSLPLVTFEEDFDLTTGTLDGVNISGGNLVHWGEQTVAMKHGRLDRKVVALEWDNQLPDPDKDDTQEAPTSQSQPAWFQLSLPPGQIQVGPGAILSLAIADDFVPAQEPNVPIDLTIQVPDQEGNLAWLPLSHFSCIQPQIPSRIGKFDFMVAIPQSEPVFQTFRFELEDFQAQNPLFQPDLLSEISLVFDRTLQGRLLISGVWLELE